MDAYNKMTLEEIAQINRRLKIIENALFGKSDRHWHGFSYLKDSTLIGKSGSLKYIVDPQTKRPISKGYHEIEVIIPNRIYKGKLGSTVREFELKTEEFKISKEEV